MSISNWNYPTTVWFGEGRVKDLHIACRNLGIKKPLFVTDKDLAKTHLVKKIISDSSLKNFSINIFSNIKGNPVGSNVDEGVKVFKKGNHDGVIAFGGGSGLDVGKAIAFMSCQNRPIWDFEDVGDNWTRANSDKIAPIIAIPTTAGTGSETGRASLITNEETQTKKIIFHPKFMPSIVILDPNLTIDLPSNLTAATGMDALAHNLEAYCASGFHPMADGIALEGMRLIKEWLLTAVNDGTNLKARSAMLVAATMGSTAFQKGLGAIHSLSHPVNSVYNVHHGLSNAIFMPYVITFNKNEIEKKIVKLSEYLELKEKNFNGFLNWILKLRKKLKIPHKLSDVINVKEDDIDKLSAMALEDPSTSGNPKKLTSSDLKLMYQYSLKGKLFHQ
ncbi:MAG: alcohol dehydrogenase [Candidatus Pelagibacter sp.]|nr:alcohol dehydrogenase [Candidatus Pelagibacter sp.]OUU60529.1 MAG: alcohol dehydrogenase [Proteobacteria bacterium TMED61]